MILTLHAGGVVSHLVGDLVLHGTPGTRFRVFGTIASYDVDAFDGQADELVAGGSPAASGDAWGVVPRERWGRLHAGHTTRPWPSERGDWTVFSTSFAGLTTSAAGEDEQRTRRRVADRGGGAGGRDIGR